MDGMIRERVTADLNDWFVSILRNDICKDHDHGGVAVKPRSLFQWSLKCDRNRDLSDTPKLSILTLVN